ncbi:aspartate/glutamate racemase family protein [Candidatus Pantoea carbekii]|uniref:HyuE protein n=1 Tax=Candidatus Pantoea carbekii TaxID=1235990 RepID=U3U9U8_9GAMM|nr:aspartate/glutamate racemase family protein [Candidatus Pantoea carbekii]AKC32257.1 hydantoin racemase HyuE [Candidatus Pantoea carbekii]BAO00793.1 HyuE protein [Candidatus Pantoea carbekii]
MSFIQVINPNTNLSITKTIDQVVRSTITSGTKILVVCAKQGVPSIEGHFDEAVATIGVLEQIKNGEKKGIDGHIIACFGDPGLLAARELVRAPVIGIAEAAMHTATLIAKRFSIIGTLSRNLSIAKSLLQQYGFSNHCTAMHSIELPVLALTEDKSGSAREKIRQCCIKVKNKDKSGAIILGCSGMALLAQELTKELDLPVIDGVSAAVKILEGLLGLGLTTSKHVDFDFPLKKSLTGIFENLN